MIKIYITDHWVNNTDISLGSELSLVAGTSDLGKRGCSQVSKDSVRLSLRETSIVPRDKRPGGDFVGCL